MLKYLIYTHFLLIISCVALAISLVYGFHKDDEARLIALRILKLYGFSILKLAFMIYVVVALHAIKTSTQATYDLVHGWDANGFSAEVQDK